MSTFWLLLICCSFFISNICGFPELSADITETEFVPFNNVTSKNDLRGTDQEHVIVDPVDFNPINTLPTNKTLDSNTDDGKHETQPANEDFLKAILLTMLGSLPDDRKSKPQPANDYYQMLLLTKLDSLPDDRKSEREPFNEDYLKVSDTDGKKSEAQLSDEDYFELLPQAKRNLTTDGRKSKTQLSDEDDLKRLLLAKLDSLPEDKKSEAHLSNDNNLKELQFH